MTVHQVPAEALADTEAFTLWCARTALRVAADDVTKWASMVRIKVGAPRGSEITPTMTMVMRSKADKGDTMAGKILDKYTEACRAYSEAATALAELDPSVSLEALIGRPNGDTPQ